MFLFTHNVLHHRILLVCNAFSRILKRPPNQSGFVIHLSLKGKAAGFNPFTTLTTKLCNWEICERNNTCIEDMNQRVLHCQPIPAKCVFVVSSQMSFAILPTHSFKSSCKCHAQQFSLHHHTHLKKLHL